ncbi:MAG TPA: type IV secretion system protein [Ramlibacter sp.]|nr:type IV secretion system protein [Ramlibacter sp.]
MGALAAWCCAYLLALRGSLRVRRNALAAAFVLLCLACTLAIGEASPAAPAPPTTATPDTYAFTAESLTNRIAENVTEKLNALKNNAQLQRLGSYLAAFFLAALLVWTSVKTMASGRGLSDLLAEWVPIFVSFGIVILFLDRSAADLIVRSMDGIAEAIGGADMSSLDAAVRACAAPILKAIAAVIAQPRATEASNVMGEGLLGWLGTLAASGASWIMGAIAKVAAAFLLVLAAVVMVAHIILGFVAVQLVLALAPVAVPFLMFRPMEWLFNGWLKFLLGACMLKIVLSFLIGVAAGLLTGMTELSQHMYQDAWKVTAMETLYTDILLLGMMLVFALLATLLVTMAPRIADGLLVGASSAAGFSGLRAVTHGASGNAGAAAGRSTSRVASGAGAAGAQDFRNMRSYLAGRDDARAGRAASLAYRDPRAKAAYATAYRKHLTPPRPPRS